MDAENGDVTLQAQTAVAIREQLRPEGFNVRGQLRAFSHHSPEYYTTNCIRLKTGDCAPPSTMRHPAMKYMPGLNVGLVVDKAPAGWEVDNVEEVVKVLREKGVVFEQYDMTDERGIATMAGVKGAWFKDSEGNILSVVQFE